MEIWDIIDHKGNRTGRTIVRGEELQEGDYHLVVHIWLVNDQGEYLIQKRAEHLKLMPGVWAITGGSALQGENSLEAAKREAKEELGINIDISKTTKIAEIIRKDNLTDVWLVRQNVKPQDITMQLEEVSDFKWATREEIENMIKEGVFHDYGEAYFERIFRCAKNV